MTLLCIFQSSWDPMGPDQFLCDFFLKSGVLICRKDMLRTHTCMRDRLWDSVSHRYFCPHWEPGKKSKISCCSSEPCRGCSFQATCLLLSHMEPRAHLVHMCGLHTGITTPVPPLQVPVQHPWHLHCLATLCISAPWVCTLYSHPVQLLPFELWLYIFEKGRNYHLFKNPFLKQCKRFLTSSVIHASRLRYMACNIILNLKLIVLRLEFLEQKSYTYSLGINPAHRCVLFGLDILAHTMFF